ncbi:MAG TPA: hypothetical protein PK587_09010 [Syntrophales bacterium]|nr:hypothetical protein [Syntrophales bacterium]
MNLLKKIFSGKKPNEDITRLSRIIGPLLDKTANDVFLAHKDILLAEPITYIVPAVWGASKDGKLTENQEEINRRITPVIRETLEVLDTANLSDSQSFAISFMIRGLIISKITYMIEALKNKMFALDVKKKDSLIRNLEPVGRA